MSATISNLGYILTLTRLISQKSPFSPSKTPSQTSKVLDKFGVSQDPDSEEGQNPYEDSCRGMLHNRECVDIFDGESKVEFGGGDASAPGGRNWEQTYEMRFTDEDMRRGWVGERNMKLRI
jgi:hypothetical protein